jgi:hypothetical protein
MLIITFLMLKKINLNFIKKKVDKKNYPLKPRNLNSF